MKRNYPLSSLVLFAVAIAPSSALALRSGEVAEVTIVTGGGSTDVGTWRFELDQLVVTPGYEACRYFVKWINAATLPSSVNLYLEELMTPGLEDCDMNSQRGIPTVVFISPAYASRGFTQFQTKDTIQSLVICESAEGEMCGVIQWNGGSIDALAVAPK